MQRATDSVHMKPKVCLLALLPPLPMRRHGTAAHVVIHGGQPSRFFAPNRELSSRSCICLSSVGASFATTHPTACRWPQADTPLFSCHNKDCDCNTNDWQRIRYAQSSRWDFIVFCAPPIEPTPHAPTRSKRAPSNATRHQKSRSCAPCHLQGACPCHSTLQSFASWPPRVPTSGNNNHTRTLGA